jgi:hypothetical protein
LGFLSVFISPVKCSTATPAFKADRPTFNYVARQFLDCAFSPQPPAESIAALMNLAWSASWIIRLDISRHLSALNIGARNTPVTVAWKQSRTFDHLLQSSEARA